jgi:hypothetical protein
VQLIIDALSTLPSALFVAIRGAAIDGVPADLTAARSASEPIVKCAMFHCR